MALEVKDKELVAIGASIGAGCRPCIDHHLRAGRDAGLTEPELARAVEVAEATQRFGAALLTQHVRELLHSEESPADAATQLVAATRADELTGLGASIGANCHPLLEEHISGALQRGLATKQLSSAIKMAEIVQQHAAEITAKRAVVAIGDLPADTSLLGGTASPARIPI